MCRNWNEQGVMGVQGWGPQPWQHLRYVTYTYETRTPWGPEFVSFTYAVPHRQFGAFGPGGVAGFDGGRTAE